MSDHFVAPGVPDELWLSVLAGVIDEDEAVARGLVAAAATSEEGRRRILFGPPERPPRPLPVTPPWFEP